MERAEIVWIKVYNEKFIEFRFDSGDLNKEKRVGSRGGEEG